MKSTRKKKTNVRKNLDLPKETVVVFDKLATDGRTKTKPYMELVLIQFAEKNKS